MGKLTGRAGCTRTDKNPKNNYTGLLSDRYDLLVRDRYDLLVRDRYDLLLRYIIEDNLARGALEPVTPGQGGGTRACYTGPGGH